MNAWQSRWGPSLQEDCLHKSRARPCRGQTTARGAQACHLLDLSLGLEVINVREPPERVDLACEWLGMPYQKWSRVYLKTQPTEGSCPAAGG